MEPANQAWDVVFEALAQLRDRWPAPVAAWSYDRRFKCVASSIPVAAVPDAEAAIALAMPQSFDVGSLPAASSAARATAEACGGLRAAQKMYWGVAGAEASCGAFGLWWPWADGATVSLRIGLHDVDAPKERYPRLRDLFGIPQAPPTPG
jgi:hypothetical protein